MPIVALSQIRPPQKPANPSLRQIRIHGEQLQLLRRRQSSPPDKAMRPRVSFQALSNG